MGFRTSTAASAHYPEPMAIETKQQTDQGIIDLVRSAEPITIRGKLELNADDINRLIYALQGTEKVKDVE